MADQIDYAGITSALNNINAGVTGLSKSFNNFTSNFTETLENAFTTFFKDNKYYVQGSQQGLKVRDTYLSDVAFTNERLTKWDTAFGRLENIENILNSFKNNISGNTPIAPGSNNGVTNTGDFGQLVTSVNAIKDAVTNANFAGLGTSINTLGTSVAKLADAIANSANLDLSSESSVSNKQQVQRITTASRTDEATNANTEATAQITKLNQILVSLEGWMDRMQQKTEKGTKNEALKNLEKSGEVDKLQNQQDGFFGSGSAKYGREIQEYNKISWEAKKKELIDDYITPFEGLFKKHFIGLRQAFVWVEGAYAGFKGISKVVKGVGKVFGKVIEPVKLLTEKFGGLALGVASLSGQFKKMMEDLTPWGMIKSTIGEFTSAFMSFTKMIMGLPAASIKEKLQSQYSTLGTAEGKINDYMRDYQISKEQAMQMAVNEAANIQRPFLYYSAWQEQTDTLQQQRDMYKNTTLSVKQINELAPAVVHMSKYMINSFDVVGSQMVKLGSRYFDDLTGMAVGVKTRIENLTNRFNVDVTAIARTMDQNMSEYLAYTADSEEEFVDSLMRNVEGMAKLESSVYGATEILNKINSERNKMAGEFFQSELGKMVLLNTQNPLAVKQKIDNFDDVEAATELVQGIRSNLQAAGLTVKNFNNEYAYGVARSRGLTDMQLVRRILAGDIKDGQGFKEYQDSKGQNKFQAMMSTLAQDFHREWLKEQYYRTGAQQKQAEYAREITMRQQKVFTDEGYIKGFSREAFQSFDIATQVATAIWGADTTEKAGSLLSDLVKIANQIFRASIDFFGIASAFIDGLLQHGLDILTPNHPARQQMADKAAVYVEDLGKRASKITNILPDFVTGSTDLLMSLVESDNITEWEKHHKKDYAQLLKVFSEEEIQAFKDSKEPSALSMQLAQKIANTANGEAVTNAIIKNYTKAISAHDLAGMETWGNKLKIFDRSEWQNMQSAMKAPTEEERNKLLNDIVWRNSPTDKNSTRVQKVEEKIASGDSLIVQVIDKVWDGFNRAIESNPTFQDIRGALEAIAEKVSLGAYKSSRTLKKEQLANTGIQQLARFAQDNPNNMELVADELWNRRASLEHELLYAPNFNQKAKAQAELNDIYQQEDKLRLLDRAKFNETYVFKHKEDSATNDPANQRILGMYPIRSIDSTQSLVSFYAQNNLAVPQATQEFTNTFNDARKSKEGIWGAFTQGQLTEADLYRAVKYGVLNPNEQLDLYNKLIPQHQNSTLFKQLSPLVNANPLNFIDPSTGGSVPTDQLLQYAIKNPLLQQEILKWALRAGDLKHTNPDIFKNLQKMPYAYQLPESQQPASAQGKPNSAQATKPAQKGQGRSSATPAPTADQATANPAQTGNKNNAPASEKAVTQEDAKKQTKAVGKGNLIAEQAAKQADKNAKEQQEQAKKGVDAIAKATGKTEVAIINMNNNALEVLKSIDEHAKYIGNLLKPILPQIDKDTPKNINDYFKFAAEVIAEERRLQQQRATMDGTEGTPVGDGNYTGMQDASVFSRNTIPSGGEFRNNRGNHLHNGVDFAIPLGTPLPASEDAIVEGTNELYTNGHGYGAYVSLIGDHTGKYIGYAHMDKVNVRRGQRVRQGDIIGTSGASGNAGRRTFGEHLHFMVCDNPYYSSQNIESFMNPLDYLQGKDIKVNRQARRGRFLPGLGRLMDMPVMPLFARLLGLRGNERGGEGSMEELFRLVVGSESGGDIAAVERGAGRNVGYGKFQFTYPDGGYVSFIRWLGSNPKYSIIYNALRGVSPDDRTATGNAWRSLKNSNYALFEDAQNQFEIYSYLAPMSEFTAGRGTAFQSAVLSFSTLFGPGGARGILSNAGVKGIANDREALIALYTYALTNRTQNGLYTNRFRGEAQKLGILQALVRIGDGDAETPAPTAEDATAENKNNASAKEGEIDYSQTDPLARPREALKNTSIGILGDERASDAVGHGLAILANFAGLSGTEGIIEGPFANGSMTGWTSRNYSSLPASGKPGYDPFADHSDYLNSSGTVFVTPADGSQMLMRVDKDVIAPEKPKEGYVPISTMSSSALGFMPDLATYKKTGYAAAPEKFGFDAKVYRGTEADLAKAENKDFANFMTQFDKAQDFIFKGYGKDGKPVLEKHTTRRGWQKEWTDIDYMFEVKKNADGSTTLIAKKRPKNATGTGAGTGTGIGGAEVERVLSTARGWIGRYFRRGEKGQCANFVREVFTEAGVPVGSTSHPTDERLLGGAGTGPGYANSFAGDDVGLLVNTGEVSPGDLVLYQNTYGSFAPGVITHVGLFEGNGNIIHRTTASAPIRRDSLNHATVAEIRRVLANAGGQIIPPSDGATEYDTPATPTARPNPTSEEATKGKNARSNPASPTVLKKPLPNPNPNPQIATILTKKGRDALHQHEVTILTEKGRRALNQQDATILTEKGHKALATYNTVTPTDDASSRIDRLGQDGSAHSDSNPRNDAVAYQSQELAEKNYLAMQENTSAINGLREDLRGNNAPPVDYGDPYPASYPANYNLGALVGAMV